jgi:hypothetical protein
MSKDAAYVLLVLAMTALWFLYWAVMAVQGILREREKNYLEAKIDFDEQRNRVEERLRRSRDDRT